MDKSYERNEYIAGVFDRSAASYSRVGPEYFKYYGKRLIEVLHVTNGSNLLDVACGRGASLFPASQISGNVTGIDFSENMVSETARIINELGCSNIQVKQMNAEELSFEDNTFDYITCGFAIQFFANHELVLLEMLRVLKPGGRIAFSVWKKREQRPIPVRVLTNYIENLDVLKRIVPKMEFGVTETLENIFSEAGFKNISIQEECRRFYFRDKEHWLGDQMSHAGRAYFEMIEEVCPSEVENYKRDVLNSLDEITDEHGIFFDANALYVIAEK